MELWKQQVIDDGFLPSDFKWFPLMEDGISPETGLIGQTALNNYDQGDTLNREGHLMTAAWILHFKLKKMSASEYQFLKRRYERVLARLQDPNDPSNFARTIVPGYWGSRYNCMSRDQMTPNLVAIAMNGMKRLGSLFWNHLKRRALCFTTNVHNNWSYPPGHPDHDAKEWKWKLPDLTILAYWNIYIRGAPLWLKIPLYPLVTVLDLDTLIGSLLKVLWYGKDSNNTDDIQHIGMLAHNHYSMPTISSWLALKIYKKYRPLARRDEFLPSEAAQYAVETNPAQVVLNAYYRHLGYGPKLNEVWRPIIEKLF